MAVLIAESGMQFGEYREQDVFYIEKSIQYQRKLSANGIKSCEFILRRERKLYFVEAKTTCPKQIQADTPEEKKEKYNAYIQDIVTKMKHSLTLYVNILVGRYTKEGVPDSLMDKDLENIEIKFLLVVKNAEMEWLAPLSDVLKKQMQDIMNIWRIRDVIVLNEQMAKNKHFIV